MRLSTFALGLLLPAATVLSGCGVGRIASPGAVATSSGSIAGKAFGGQQPLTGATIVLYSYGNTGTGTRGGVLARTGTDTSGNFNIDPSTINCPSPDTQLYIVVLGGNPGTGNNSAISLAAGLGTCSNALNSYVTINEISTAMLAYTFSHFFGNTDGDGITSDHFGSAASAVSVIATGNSGTLPTLIDTQNSYPRPNTSTFNFEGAKLVSIANILGACINSAGPSSPSCKNLFSYTKPASGSAPVNTLEAAVNMALYPKQNVAKLFALQPSSGSAAFSGGLTTAPADWVLGASYTTPSFALGVDSRSVSTVDIDSTGRVWFPSNGSGLAGVGYFDPSSGNFSQLFPGSITHPQQVAIDNNGFLWANDSQSANVAGFPLTNPTSPTVLSIAGTSTTAVTVAVDDSIRFGLVATNGKPSLATVTGEQNYSVIQNTQFTGTNYFISTLAADTDGNIGVGAQLTNNGTTQDFEVDSSGAVSSLGSHARDSGQAAWTGSDFVQARGGYGAKQDGLCIFSQGGCFGMATTGQRHPGALSVDGAQTVWLADNDTPTVEQIPYTNSSYLNSSNLANNTVYNHGSNNGSTLTAPAGIAIDGAGNVWVSNYGCFATSCSPGNSFTLSELIGLAAPTETPVSGPIVTNPSGAQPVVKTTGVRR